MTRVRFSCQGEQWVADVPEGTSLLDAADACGAWVGHSCGGVCACSTCHVYLRSGAATVSPQDDDEADRLEQAFDVRQSSRLACQARVGAQAVEVAISPESLAAYMDENPDLRRRLELEGKWPPQGRS